MQQKNNRFFIAIAVFIVFSAANAFCGNIEPITSVPVSALNPQTPEKVELGKQLFFDRRLSGDGTMSCATCHVPDLAFTDGQDISFSYPTTKNWRNAPTLINVAFFSNLFHDGRATSLEDQALFPIMSSFEMNLNLDYLEEKLRVVPEYVAAFRKIFRGDITRERVAMALAAFERTLVSTNAPIDRFLKGDQSALSEDARKGYEIFAGKGRCAECHYGAKLSDDKFYALNVPENPDHQTDSRITATRRFVAKVYHYGDYANLSEDPGRYLITKDKKDWKAFRTPTLREVARTAPYMHNGVFATIDEVIDFINRGGGKGNSVIEPLGLNGEEKRQLKTFLLEALSGEGPAIKYPAVP
ncbi:MAG TPA: cytochrome c peroxidase [Dissulfurispiraceae bacterium]|nr:cytochrome c peroxidase [Dissulfurispiraceae bacterium]